METSDRKLNGITEGVIWKQLIIFIVPIFFQSVFQQLFGIADAVIVGKGIGTYALGAINATSNLVRLFLNFFIGLCSGAATVTGQAWGAKDSGRISRSVHTGMAFAMTGGLLSAGFCVPMTPLFMKFMRVPADMLSYSSAYTRIIFLGFFGVFVYDLGAAVLRAIGDSKRPFYYLIAALGLNIFLDLLFVLVFRWGVTGAAAATALSQLLSAALVTLRLCRTDNDAKLFIGKIRFHRAELRDLIRFGIPNGISGVFYSIANIAVQTTVNSLGSDIITGWSIHVKIDALVWSIYSAFSISAATFTAQNYGAGRMDRVKKSVGTCLRVCASVIIPVCLLIFIFVRPLAHMFVNDETVIDYAVYVCRFMAPFYILYMPGELLSASMRGCGETFRPMLLALIGTCGFRVMWVIMLHVLTEPSLFNVTLCYPLSWLFHSALVILYYLFGRWRSRLEADQA